MQTTIEARDADPPRQIAQRAHHRRRPFVMTANILGGDDRNRQNLGVGDLRPHITAMPQAFHQRVDHDKSSYESSAKSRNFTNPMPGVEAAGGPGIAMAAPESP